MTSDWNRTRTDYDDDGTSRIHAALLSIAGILGEDLMQDVVLVGGLVPRLHFPTVPTGVAPHVGTRDIDLALQLSIFDEARYADIARHLKHAGLTPDTNIRDDGTETLTQARWKIGEGGTPVLIDFVMARPENEERKAGSVKHLGNDLGAYIMDALVMTATDHVSMKLDGQNLKGETTQQTIKVVGLATFVVLKALAIANRRKLKDVYDLCWVLEAAGPKVIGAQFKAHSPSDHTTKALEILGTKFQSPTHEGPSWAVEFEQGPNAKDEARAQDIVGLVTQFIRAAIES
jgi:hypothetical protein